MKHKFFRINDHELGNSIINYIGEVHEDFDDEKSFYKSVPQDVDIFNEADSYARAQSQLHVVNQDGIIYLTFVGDSPIDELNLENDGAVAFKTPNTFAKFPKFIIEKI